MTKGILLIALGAPEYGWMAANLAASIRYGDKTIPIHLVWSDRALSQVSPAHKALFTTTSECPPEYYTREGKPEYIKAKTHMYDLSPYDTTLFLDVDMFILPHANMTNFIDGLSKVCDWTIENRGFEDLSKPDEKIRADYSTWCNVLEVKKHFKTTGRFYHLHSELVFFKKKAKNKKFFTKVREIYDQRPVKWKVFDGSVPDEYAFDIATCITGHHPHEDGYISIYWHGMDGRKDWNREVIKNYIGFSLGGNFIPVWIEQKMRSYKNLFRQSLKLLHMYNVPPKKRWNKNRMMI